MAQQVKIANATYNDVPSILCPDANGVFHPFVDPSVTTATANDVVSGKQFINSAGTIVNGLLTLGLEYETGTWTPSSNTVDYTIPFQNAHTEPPFFYLIANASNTYNSQTNTNQAAFYASWQKIFGVSIRPSSDTSYAANLAYLYRGNSSSSLTASNYALSSTTDYAKTTGIRAYTLSSNRYWRSGIHYKWIAVWNPTS